MARKRAASLDDFGIECIVEWLGWIARDDLESNDTSPRINRFRRRIWRFVGSHPDVTERHWTLFKQEFYPRRKTALERTAEATKREQDVAYSTRPFIYVSKEAQKLLRKNGLDVAAGGTVIRGK